MYYYALFSFNHPQKHILKNLFFEIKLFSYNYNSFLYNFIRYTKKSNSEKSSTTVYAFLLKWTDSYLRLKAPRSSSQTVVTLLGYNRKLDFEYVESRGLVIHIPYIPFNKMPCQWAWVFKITDVIN